MQADGNAIDIDRFLSDEARRRKPGGLLKIVRQFAGVEGVVGMHGGLPPSDLFPIKSIAIERADPCSPSTSCTVTHADPMELATFQQYNLHFMGYPPLRTWLQALVHRMQRPARPDFDLCIVNGASHSMETIFRMLLNVGDAVLVEEYLFSQVLDSIIIPIGYKPIGVAMDEEGMLAEALDRAILDAEGAHGRKPRVLYTCPHSQNPTGAVMSPARKAAIYRVCQAHDVLILEDDPYTYLQFPDGPDNVPGSHVEPGFLHWDTDGRVIRMDTFSKCVAPGLRLGWLSGHPSAVRLCCEAVFASTMGPAGASQLLAHSLTSQWGVEGFEAHLRHVQRRYAGNAAALDAALMEHCGNGLATWTQPRAGMFCWVRLEGCEDVLDLQEELVEHKVVIVPGRFFHWRGQDPDFKCNYARLAFSNGTHEQLREGARRLGAVLRAVADRRAHTNGTGA